MTLVRFVADSLVRDYLRMRALPEMLHNAAVSVVEGRLIVGRLPLLDDALCSDIDGQAVPLPDLRAQGALRDD